MQASYVNAPLVKKRAGRKRKTLQRHDDDGRRADERELRLKRDGIEELIFPNSEPRLEVNTTYSVYSRNKHRNKCTVNFDTKKKFLGGDGDQILQRSVAEP